MTIIELLNWVDELSVSLTLDDTFEMWTSHRFERSEVTSAWWYLHRQDVFDRFVPELVRELRSDGRFGVVDGRLTPVASNIELTRLRSQDRLSCEEIRLQEGR